MRHLGVHHWWERLVLKHDFGMYLTTVAKLSSCKKPDTVSS
jgi:hypothetical protein